MKLLITSVGSLLGQNILDTIETRRSMIRVIGMNHTADNPRNFRCDKVYLVQGTETDQFYKEFTAIVEKENPDFILPARDGDSIFLSDYKSNRPEEFAKKYPLAVHSFPGLLLTNIKRISSVRKTSLHLQIQLW